jgi:hypothetical protein
MYNYITFTDIKYRRFENESSKKILTNEQKNKDVHGSYGALLFDKRWKNKREEILLRDSHACLNCKGNLKLQVHHRQYHFIEQNNRFKLPWDYPHHLLITLCERCHQKGHSKFKVPTIKV